MRTTSIFMALLASVCFAHASSPSLRGGGAQEGSNSMRQLDDQDDTSLATPSDPSQLLGWLFNLFYMNQGDENDEGEADYIVEFDDDLEDIELVAEEIALSLEKKPARIYTKLIHGFTISGITPAMADKIAQAPEVKRIEKDDEVTMDGELIRHLARNDPNMPQEMPWGIERVGGGKNTYTGNRLAFVVDSGIDLDHSDLNVHPTLRFSAFGDDANDENGHGTHVAGIIAAKKNGFGVIGVAPGATVVPVKVLNEKGRGSMSNIIRGLEWIAQVGKKGDVVNISISGNANDALDEALRRVAGMGIKFTRSAGNGSTYAETRSPSRTNHRNIKTVCASDKDDTFLGFSNRGKPPVDFCAPGQGIVSTFRGGIYAQMQGTSMAAPHAAGVLMLGKKKRRGTKISDKDGTQYQIIECRN